MTKKTQKLKADFAKKLPPGLGKPCIINTAAPPFVFIAFYDAQSHELTSRSIRGNQFILADYGHGKIGASTLHGIIEIVDESIPLFAMIALTNHETRGKKLEPYEMMIREMYCEAIGISA